MAALVGYGIVAMVAPGYGGPSPSQVTMMYHFRFVPVILMTDGDDAERHNCPRCIDNRTDAEQYAEPQPSLRPT